MSDTPKTDAVADDSWSGGVALVPYEFAQQQERRIAELEKALREICDKQSFHTIQEMRQLASKALGL